MSADIALLIPAYRPSDALPDLITQLRTLDSCGIIHPIIVVDDGSGAEFSPIFKKSECRPKVTILRHAVNLGKGAALKTGFNHFLLAFPDAAGLVTADADGQHAVEDILNVARELSEHPDQLVLGVRAFAGKVPLRSRLGNELTRRIFQVFTGADIVDTQTGLRGWPRLYCQESLPIAINGYDFELECLMRAQQGSKFSVRQVPIKTIYLDGNQASHFNPIRDSMRIYFVFIRYCGVSLGAAITDSLVFSLVYRASGNLAASQISGRAVAIGVAFAFARNLVFHSHTSALRSFTKFLALVVVMGFVSYSMLSFLHRTTDMPLLACKMTAEGLLFLANFAIQRQLVFVRSKAENGDDSAGNQHPMPSPEWSQAQRSSESKLLEGRGAMLTRKSKRDPSNVATDWDRYYQSVPFTAHLTRKYTKSVLLSLMRKFTHANRAPAAVVEIGGANSCFLDAILGAIRPAAYHVIDSNEYGLSLLRERVGSRPDVFLHQKDVLHLEDSGLRAGTVFSVGLIEHFDTAGTKQAIRAHFDLLYSGGYAMISFPTPTWLYVVARKIAETLGLWHFTDERPLKLEEVREAVAEFGEVVFEKTLWPLVFTQHLIVVRKADAAGGSPAVI